LNRHGKAGFAGRSARCGKKGKRREISTHVQRGPRRARRWAQGGGEVNLLSHLAQTFKTRRLGRFPYNPSLFIRTGSHEPLALRLSAHNQHAPGDTTGAPTALCVARLDSLPHLAMRMLLREGNAPMVLHARAFCILLGLHVCMRVCTRTRTRASFLTRRHTHGTLANESRNARRGSKHACRETSAHADQHARTHPVGNFLPGQLGLVGAVNERGSRAALIAIATASASARAGRGKRDVGRAHAQDAAPVADEGPVI